MEARKSNNISYSHTYIESNVSQLFGKVLYALKNRRRRLILKALDESEVMSIGEIRKYLQAGKSSNNTITNSYLKPWIEVGALEKKVRGLYKITSFGKKISKVIKSHQEFDLLRRPGHQSLSTEFVLLELRDGKKKYQELMAKLGLSDPWKIVKKLKDESLLKVNHPRNLIHVPHLFRFSVSPYLLFVEGIKDYIGKTDSSWFTEYSIIIHLNRKWQNIFGRSMEINEVRELLKKGIENGDITKTNGSYEISIKDLTVSTEDLSPSEKKILDLISEGYALTSTITEKIGFHFASVHKILKKLEKKNLVVRDIERVTVELTEKGKRLANSLFEIKECVAREIGW